MLSTMTKWLAGAAVLVLMVLALRWLTAPPPLAANATPCERDCINDSGGSRWCAEFCKTHDSYGPAKK